MSPVVLTLLPHTPNVEIKFGFKRFLLRAKFALFLFIFFVGVLHMFYFSGSYG